MIASAATPPPARFHHGFGSPPNGSCVGSGSGERSGSGSGGARKSSALVSASSGRGGSHRGVLRCSLIRVSCSQCANSGSGADKVVRVPVEEGDAARAEGRRAERLAANLWRWTTPHPRWRPGDDRPGGWEQDVGSVLYAHGDAIAIFDPLAGEDDDALWRFLDERAAGAGRIVILLTASWHLRSAPAIA